MILAAALVIPAILSMPVSIVSTPLLPSVAATPGIIVSALLLAPMRICLSAIIVHTLLSAAVASLLLPILALLHTGTLLMLHAGTSVRTTLALHLGLRAHAGKHQTRKHRGNHADLAHFARENVHKSLLLRIRKYLNYPSVNSVAVKSGFVTACYGNVIP